VVEVSGHPMGIRNRFSKADQDQLGLFLATHPGDRSGNAIYQEFAQTHTHHPWQAWRHHYIHNSLLMEAVIRRMKREMLAKKNQASANENDKERSESPTEEIEVIDQQGPGTRKGKEKAPCRLEIDSDSDSAESDACNKRSTGVLQDFALHRIPNECRDRSRTCDSITDQAFPNQLGKTHSNPSVQVITLSRDEEQKLFDFISAYPQGDFRLSSILYEKYHSQVPKYSADEYRTYYLANQDRLIRKRSASREPEENGRVKSKKHTSLLVDETPAAVSRVNSSTGSDDRRTLVLDDGGNEVTTRSSEDTVSEFDYLSVSTGSSDDLELEYILACPDHAEVAHNLDMSDELFHSLLELQGDVFQPLDLDASAPSQDPHPAPTNQAHPSRPALQDGDASPSIIPEKELELRPLVHSPESRADVEEESQGAPAVAREPVPGESLQVPTEPNGSATLKRGESSVPASGMTSRRSSFKPAQPPTSVQEALELLSIFLDDFGEFYSPTEAAELFHQCGDWSLMFEVATLKRLDHERQNASNNGHDDDDDAGDMHVGQEYKIRILNLIWTPAEDHLILHPHSSPEQLKRLMEKRGAQAVENRRAFLLSSD